MTLTNQKFCRPPLAALLVLLLLPAALLGAIAIELPNAEESLKFAVIGDSGSGSGRQYQLAAQFNASHKLFPFTFVLMLGDNIYGSERPRDFERKFELPYKPVLEAGVPFYAALGNHDEPAIQTNYALFNLGGKRYHSFRKGDAEFFVLDSTYMTTTQVRWLEQALQDSDAPWKIAYMHHPIYSSGKRHGSDVELRAFIEPLLIRYGVSVVLAGHEHFYERLKPQNGIAYFTAGSAGKLRAGNIQRGPFFAAGYDRDLSFMLMEIVGDTLHFQVISRTAATVDKGTVTRRQM
jgi:predicted phosphodiesterase